MNATVSSHQRQIPVITDKCPNFDSPIPHSQKFEFLRTYNSKSFVELHGSRNEKNIQPQETSPPLKPEKKIPRKSAPTQRPLGDLVKESAGKIIKNNAEL